MVNEIGNRIKELRIENNLSQKELADKLSVMQHTVSTYENNITRSSLDVLIRLADILDTTTDYLLCRTDFY